MNTCENIEKALNVLKNIDCKSTLKVKLSDNGSYWAALVIDESRIVAELSDGEDLQCYAPTIGQAINGLDIICGLEF